MCGEHAVYRTLTLCVWGACSVQETPPLCVGSMQCTGDSPSVCGEHAVYRRLTLCVWGACSVQETPPLCVGSMQCTGDSPSVCGEVKGNTEALLPSLDVLLVELIAVLHCTVACILCVWGGGGGGGER